MTVTLANRNEAPSANAGSDQTGIQGGATVTLSGSGSDPDADNTLSYVWSQTAGTSVTLASDSSAQATFSAPSDLTANETLTFRLRVTDSGGLFAEDETDVTVLAAPADPDGTRAGATRLTVTPRRTHHRLVTDALDRAAGDSVDYYVFTLSERQELRLGVRDQTINLDATLEDASGDALMESWPPPADATVEWLKPTLDTGTYYIRVEAAEDGATRYRIRFGLDDPPSPPPSAPVVTGSTSFTVTEGEIAVATLSATDEDTSAEDLEWSLAGGADEGKFALTAGGALSFGSAKDYENPDDSGTDGTYNVTVQVSDGTNSATADVTVALANRNEAPSADAGSDQTGIAGGATVTLSGSGSDPDADDTLSYAWGQTAGTSVTLASASSAEATFSAPSGLAANETLTFRLRVTDAGGLFVEDDTDVTVLAAPSDPDGTRAGATRLTATPRRTVHRLATGSLDRATGDTVDYYVFTLSERQELGLGVRDQTIDLDGTLEHASGDVLMETWPPPVDSTVEWLKTTLDTGTYYIRVEAAEDGATGYRIRFGLSDPASGANAASASDGGGDDDFEPLLILDDVTPGIAAVALFNEMELGEAQLDALDRLGNRNGRFDLGDLLSWRARCRRGEARCGSTPAPAGAAILGAIAVPSAAGSPSRTRRRKGARRPSRRPGIRFRRAAVRLRTLILALAVWTWGCGLADDPVQPQPADAAGEPEPGRLLVRLAVLPGAQAAGAMILIEGPGIDSLHAHGLELIQSGKSSPTRQEVIVAGELGNGPVLEVWVPHVGDHGHYRVRLLEVAGEDYSLRDPAEYTATISR